MRHGRAADRHRHDAVLRHRGIDAAAARLGDGYADALGRQRSVLRTPGAWNGVEMGTEGDSFFVVFATRATRSTPPSRRSGELLAARLAAAASRCAVRMGIHTGEPDAARGRLHRHGRAPGGPGRRRRPRRPDRADGGDAADRGEAACPTVRAATTSGRHRLKDMPDTGAPVPGRPPTGSSRDFPPLRSLGGRPRACRGRATPLIGRDAELAELTRWSPTPRSGW